MRQQYLHTAVSGMRQKHGRYAAIIVAMTFLMILASCGFFVDPVLTSITLTPSTALLKVGATQQFSAMGVNQDSSTRTVSPTWTSSDVTVATISTKGLALGLASGTSTITATVGSITSTAALTVSNLTIQSIAIGNCPTTLTHGNTVSLTATATMSDSSTTVSTTQATWTSDNTSAVTVASSGVATAGASASGLTANITASYQSVTSAVCSIQVL